MQIRSIGAACSAFVLSLVLVGCAGPTPNEHGLWGVDEAGVMSLVDKLCADEMEGRGAGTAGIELARDLLVLRLQAAGLKPGFVIDGEPSYTQPFELRIGTDAEGEPVRATVENVGAILPGVGVLKDQVVVVGGHYDHIGYGEVGSRARDQRGEIHPGADDNASGAAAVVLLAKHFERAARMGSDTIRPRRTIFFTCFAGEERGLLGSRYMVRHPEQFAFDADEISGMVNMDMIGRLRNDELYVFADDTGQQWRDWITQANEPVGLDLKWDVRPPGGSDHSLFIAASVPAVFFNTWLHEDYHTPRDTADKLNVPGSVEVIRLVAGLVRRIATEPERLTFVPPKPRPPRPYLGVMLGDKRLEGGVLLGSLAPDGPMEQGGAKPGDVLLSIDGRAMNSAGDIRGFLAKAKAGTKVTIAVRRGDETVELKIVLGVRR
ncbi:MAG: M28 family peptidase [Phycisphaeraceae bacterium]